MVASFNVTPHTAPELEARSPAPAQPGAASRPRDGLDPESRALVLQSLAEFGRRELSDEVLRALDHADRFPEPLVRALFGAELGLHLLFLPESVGGLGAGARDICAVSEAMAALDLGVATSVLATALGTDPIRVGGTPAQQARWLAAIAEGGLLVAYGVTEPGAGSNVAALRTRAEAVREAPGGPVTAYRLSGRKCFITNGSVADLYTVLARAPGGPSFFVVPRGTPGLQPGRKEEKHGIRASDTAEVILEDVVVPADHLLGGEEGQGLAHAAKVFGYTRLMVAAFGLGAGVDAQRRAIAYARERIQFDTPLVAKQGLTHKLVLPHVAALQAARAYIQEVAGRLDAAEADLQVEASIAKLFACEAGNRAADAAVQVHGGYGYVREYHVEKIRRDVRITTIYEGTSEIQQEVAGRGRWRQLLVGGGSLYRDLAEAMRSLDSAGVDVGADNVGRGAAALSELVRRARAARLGRQQHVIFQLADAIAALETAAALTRKAASWQRHGAAEATAPGWADRLAALARVQSAVAAEEVGRIAYRVLASTGTLDAAALAEERGPLHPGTLLGAWDGRLADLDHLAAWLPDHDLLADPALPGA
jgi:alkylation response protein AidB-like acyl-CoA dehydrogenase